MHSLNMLLAVRMSESFFLVEDEADCWEHDNVPETAHGNWQHKLFPFPVG